MASANTDYFTEVGNPGSATTLAAPGHSIAGTTFNVVSTSNWPTTTGVVFAVDTFTLQTVNGVANVAVRTAGSYTEWEGTVASSTSITNATLRYGTDQNYSAGSTTRVYIPVASSRENRLVQGLQVQHNQDGTHAAVTATSLVTTGAVTAGNGLTLSAGTLTLPNNSIAAANLATTAITLGYAQITTTFTDNSGTTTAKQITGLTATVTIPAGGRRIKITGYSADVGTNTTAATVNMSIWDGAVGSGTQLNWNRITTKAASALQMNIVMAVVTPSAGSKTYNLGLQSDAGGAPPFIEASATSPAFILVEAI